MKAAAVEEGHAMLAELEGCQRREEVAPAVKMEAAMEAPRLPGLSEEVRAVGPGLPLAEEAVGPDLDSGSAAAVIQGKLGALQTCFRPASLLPALVSLVVAEAEAVQGLRAREWRSLNLREHAQVCRHLAMEVARQIGF